MKKLGLEELDLENKLCIVRCDFNVPLSKDGKIQNDYRIKSSLPTIQYLRDKGARIVLLSHLGRPQGKVIDAFRLAPVAECLGLLLGTKIFYVEECIGPKAKAGVAALKSGQIGLLENVRFHKAETENDLGFAEELAHGADYFINDAFGTAHRAHASTSGIAQFVQASAAGVLLQKEIDYLSQVIENPKRPLLAVCGGAKVSTKIQLLQKLLHAVDHLLIGGGMCFTFLRAMGHETGRSLVEEEQCGIAKAVLDEFADKIMLPVDFMVTPEFSMEEEKIGELRAVPFDEIPPDCWGLDIGPKSIAAFTKSIERAKTIFWNGPMGVFELDPAAQGTYSLAKVVGQASENDSITIIGGGDSVAAVAKSGLEEKISHISTGGGATLAFLENPELPGIQALTSA